MHGANRTARRRMVALFFMFTGTERAGSKWSGVQDGASAPIEIVQASTLSPRGRAGPLDAATDAVAAPIHQLGPYKGRTRVGHENSRRSGARIRARAQPVADVGAHRHRWLGPGPMH